MFSGGCAAHADAVHLRPQPWRWSYPRVLVEHRDEAAGLAIASGLRFAGYAVAVCPGPAERGQYPLVGPEGCAPAQDADLVVCGLGYERERPIDLESVTDQGPAERAAAWLPADGSDPYDRAGGEGSHSSTSLREAAREVLRELRTHYPKTPLLVEAPFDMDADLRELLDGCAQLPAPATPEQIVAAVQSLLGEAAEEVPSGA